MTARAVPRRRRFYSRTGFWADLAEGIGLWRVWTHLAGREIRLEYDRSGLGPFWSTASIAVLIAGQGLLFSLLLGVDARAHTVWLGVGLVVWLTMSGVMSTGPSLFLSAHAQLLNIRAPFSFFVLRNVMRFVLSFAHHAPILLVLSLVGYGTVHWTAIYALYGLLILFLTSIWVTYLLGLLGVKFRALTHLVPTILPAAFLFTPIVWNPEQLRQYAWLVDFNPFYHYVELVRQPILGHAPSVLSLAITGVLLVAGFIVANIAHVLIRPSLMVSV